MKKNRNCGMMSPIPMGGMPVQMPMPMGVAYNTYGGDNDSYLQSQISSLEQRVTNLENMVNGTYSNASNYNSNYNSSNYQMM